MSRRCRKCHFAPCRCDDLKAGYAPAQAAKGSWPICSDAAGCHPSQIPEAMEEAKRLGVRVEFEKDGRVKFDNEAHKRQYSKAIGLRDRSGFLG